MKQHLGVWVREKMTNYQGTLPLAGNGYVSMLTIQTLNAF